MILTLHMICASNFTFNGQKKNENTQIHYPTDFTNPRENPYYFNCETNRGNYINKSLQIINPLNIKLNSHSTDFVCPNTIPYHGLHDNKAEHPRKNSIEKDKYLVFADNKYFNINTLNRPTQNYKKCMENQNIYPDHFENGDKEDKNSNRKMKMYKSKAIHHNQITEIEQNSSNENNNVELFTESGKIFSGNCHLLNKTSVKNNLEEKYCNPVTENYDQNFYPIQKQRDLKCRHLWKLYENFFFLEQDFNKHEKHVGECAEGFSLSQIAKNIDFLCNSNFIESDITDELFQSVLSGLPTFKAIAQRL